MSLTPDKLRAAAKNGRERGGAQWAPVSAEDADMLADAVEIADEMAWVDIECNCNVPEWNVQPKWYDTAAIDHLMNKDEMARNVRYLDARGLIEHHPEHPAWVRLKEGA